MSTILGKNSWKVVVIIDRYDRKCDRRICDHKSIMERCPKNLKKSDFRFDPMICTLEIFYFYFF